MALNSPIPNNSRLRALLETLEIARKAKSTRLLDLIVELADDADHEDVHIVTTWYKDSHKKKSERYYSEYTAEDCIHSYNKLQKKAYGTFVEAATHLMADAFNYGHPTYQPSAPLFMELYFSSEDAAVWTKWTREYKEIEHTSDEPYARMDLLLNEIRSYLQTYLGPLYTARVGSYMNAAKTTGASVRVVKKGAGFVISGPDILTEPLQKQLTTKTDTLPSKVNGLELHSVDTFTLFEHEL